MKRPKAMHWGESFSREETSSSSSSGRIGASFRTTDSRFTARDAALKLMTWCLFLFVSIFYGLNMFECNPTCADSDEQEEGCLHQAALCHRLSRREVRGAVEGCSTWQAYMERPRGMSMADRARSTIAWWNSRPFVQLQHHKPYL